jgi:hypothetical protein
MNYLSWLIYLSSLCGSLSGLLLAASIAAVALTIFCFLAYSISEFGDEYEEFIPFWKQRVKIFFIISLIVVPPAILIPGQDTVMMIAASQFGEQVINNPESKDVLDNLKERILRELNNDKNKKKDN